MYLPRLKRRRLENTNPSSFPVPPTSTQRRHGGNKCQWRGIRIHAPMPRCPWAPKRAVPPTLVAEPALKCGIMCRPILASDMPSTSRRPPRSGWRRCCDSTATAGGSSIGCRGLAALPWKARVPLSPSICAEPWPCCFSCSATASRSERCCL